MNEDTKEKAGLYRSIFESAADGMMIIDLETSLVVEANPPAWLMHGYARNEFLELQLQACIHPDSQYVFNESLQIFRSTGVFDIRALHVCRNGTTFFADWRGTAFTHEGRPCLLGIIRDVSKQIQMEQSLSQRVEVRTHEQATLLEISHTLASTLELQPGLILDQLRKIIKYSHGGLFALEGSSLVTLAMRGTGHLEDSLPIHIHLSDPETLVALFNKHHPIRIADVWSSDPQAQFLRTLLNDGSAVLLEGMQSWMWAWLKAQKIISQRTMPTWR